MTFIDVKVVYVEVGGEDASWVKGLKGLKGIKLRLLNRAPQLMNLTSYWHPQLYVNDLELTEKTSLYTTLYYLRLPTLNKTII